MSSMQKLYQTILLLTVTVIVSSCSTVILESIPAGGAVPYNEIVYAENDGRCKKGQIIRITGGNDSNNIPRKYECISRP